MTSGSVLGSRLVVVGVDVEGAEVARLTLGHGDDPTTLLAAHGWEVRRVRDVLSHPVEKHMLTMTFVVAPSCARPQTVALLTMGVPPRRDDDLVTAEGEVALRHQRVAAYAFVTSSRGVLMTQFSDRTNAQGQWGLPGGGLEDFHAVRVVYRAVCPEPT